MTRRAHLSGHIGSTPGRQSQHQKLWTLRDPETLNLLFQAFEDLTILRQHCGQKIRVAREEERLFGSLLEDDESGLRRWSYMSVRVETSWSLLDHTLRTTRLDPTQFQEAYRKCCGYGQPGRA